MDSDLRIRVPDEFTAEHERLILKYLIEGRQALAFVEWKSVLSGFDLLHKAIAEVGRVRQTFRQVYEEYVDTPFADLYINRLLALDDVVREQSALWAVMARAIVNHLQQAKLRTIPALLSQATSHFPSPAVVTLESGMVIIADYNVWKAKVWQRQQSQGQEE
jgi:hypothetical protein